MGSSHEYFVFYFDIRTLAFCPLHSVYFHWIVIHKKYKLKQYNNGESFRHGEYWRKVIKSWENEWNYSQMCSGEQCFPYYILYIIYMVFQTWGSKSSFISKLIFNLYFYFVNNILMNLFIEVILWITTAVKLWFDMHHWVWPWGM